MSAASRTASAASRLAACYSVDSLTCQHHKRPVLIPKYTALDHPNTAASIGHTPTVTLADSLQCNSVQRQLYPQQAQSSHTLHPQCKAALKYVLNITPYNAWNLSRLRHRQKHPSPFILKTPSLAPHISSYMHDSPRTPMHQHARATRITQVTFMHSNQISDVPKD